MKRTNFLKRFFLEKKRVIVISNNKIHNKNIGFITRLFNISIFLWTVYASYCFFINGRFIQEKNQQIQDLSLVNNNLQTNLTNLEGMVANFNQYLESLNLYDRFDNIQSFRISRDVVIDDNLLKNGVYSEVLPVLDRINVNLNKVEARLDSRISNLEELIKESGVSDEKIKSIYKKSVSGNDLSGAMAQKVDYLTYLESFLNAMPITQPMRDYRVTSKFGTRLDPFIKTRKMHKGLDLAGPINAKVLAPSDGVVVFVGSKNGYGNYLKIQHKNSITTEYGHLKKILVKAGDIVKRGNIIALQGNTGRSTNDHLHYETKIDGTVKDPINFIYLGQKVF